MAMTNQEIIWNTKKALVVGGVIDSMDTEIHTFQGWKERGFKVKKGEHSQIRFSIWKYSGKTVEKEDGTEIETGHCFLKESCWFTEKQVEQVK